jgi:segregation and condensation protein A
MNVGALADFVAMGARLLLLKSRALLPREDQPADDAGSEEDAADPEALVLALQEYRRYKQAAGHLRSLQDAQRTTYRRTAAPPELPLPTGLDTVSLDGLVQLFRDILDRMPVEEPRPVVRREPVRLRDRIARLVERLDASGSASFRELIGSAQTRVEVVVDFLAVLELIKARYLEAQQDDAFGDIALVRISGAVAALDGIEAQLAEDFSGT